MESRIWNLEEPAASAASTMSTKIRSVLISHMWDEIHIKATLRITENSKNLSSLGLLKKISCLKQLVATTMIHLDKTTFIATKNNTGQSYTLGQV